MDKQELPCHGTYATFVRFILLRKMRQDTAHRETLASSLMTTQPPSISGNLHVNLRNEREKHMQCIESVKNMRNVISYEPFIECSSQIVALPLIAVALKSSRKGPPTLQLAVSLLSLL